MDLLATTVRRARPLAPVWVKEGCERGWYEAIGLSFGSEKRVTIASIPRNSPFKRNQSDHCALAHRVSPSLGVTVEGLIAIALGSI